MDPATLQRIWEPFSRPSLRPRDGTRSPRYTGGQAERRFVWANRSGQGTVISLYWPEDLLQAEHLPEARPVRSGRARYGDGAGVEDEPLVRSLTVRTLSRLVTTARGRDRGRRVADGLGGRVDPDLVITDVVLPEASAAGWGQSLSTIPISRSCHVGFTDEEVFGGACSDGSALSFRSPLPQQSSPRGAHRARRNRPGLPAAGCCRRIRSHNGGPMQRKPPHFAPSTDRCGQVLRS